MSAKRTRQAFEADAQAQAQHSPYVAYGTPLPPLDSEVRDDGSYVPVWKQEVRDEQGRKRLHGAFTGGWSAGYFNTVGSKEGWAPSTFVSSRSNRHKDGPDQATVARPQRPEDFMDDEDLADAADAQKLQTTESFAGLGSTKADGVRQGSMTDIFRTRGETMGVKLLRRMGWRDGQGIGPKVRRRARLDTQTSMADDAVEMHLFAPDDVPLVAFVKKLDHKGLGFEGAARLAPATFGMRNNKIDAAESSEDDDEHEGPALRRPGATTLKKKTKTSKGGIGMGILNDTGSDDEDPYEIGPRISYNRVIGGDRKKNKLKPNPAASTTFGSGPKFKSRKTTLAMAGKNLRKCHDGRLPLEGFVFGREPDVFSSSTAGEVKYPPPKIPPGWLSSISLKAKDNAESKAAGYLSTADAAKASSLDPKARAALLGEAQLPGKSVFDFLSPEARERLAAASGKANLPPALSEIPEGYALSEEEKQAQILRQIPQIDKQTAAAALGRGAAGSGPYVDNEAKRTRYRQFLEYFAGFTQQVPSRPPGFKDNDWLRELNEFYSCARIFKPMTGMMASRFTTSSTKLPTNGNSSAAENSADEKQLIHRPPPKPSDPAEEAAKMGMYGHLTRSSTDFYPTRLLCKRFNVRPPAHVVPDTEADSSISGSAKDRKEPDWGSLGVASLPSFSSGGIYQHGSTVQSAGAQQAVPADISGSREAMTLDELMAEAQTQAGTEQQQSMKEIEVNADVNDALEGKRAEDNVLRAIFGDSSDDEE
ncbi:G patch domain-containing protein 1 [Microdochium nivale]|nr:G patch domain-containing protein 1 [Microdochium nivale]